MTNTATTPTPTLEDIQRAGLSGYREGATRRAAGRAYPETIERARVYVRQLRADGLESTTLAAQSRGYLRGLLGS